MRYKKMFNFFKLNYNKTIKELEKEIKTLTAKRKSYQTWAKQIRDEIAYYTIPVYLRKHDCTTLYIQLNGYEEKIKEFTKEIEAKTARIERLKNL